MGIPWQHVRNNLCAHCGHLTHHVHSSFGTSPSVCFGAAVWGSASWRRSAWWLVSQKKIWSKSRAFSGFVSLFPQLVASSPSSILPALEWSQRCSATFRRSSRLANWLLELSCSIRNFILARAVRTWNIPHGSWHPSRSNRDSTGMRWEPNFQTGEWITPRKRTRTARQPGILETAPVPGTGVTVPLASAPSSPFLGLEFFPGDRQWESLQWPRLWKSLVIWVLKNPLLVMVSHLSQLTQIAKVKQRLVDSHDALSKFLRPDSSQQASCYASSSLWPSWLIRNAWSCQVRSSKLYIYMYLSLSLAFSFSTLS